MANPVLPNLVKFQVLIWLLIILLGETINFFEPNLCDYTYGLSY